MKTAVLISGRGSNLQALIDAAAQPGYPAKLVLVISNVADVEGLKRAERARIATKVIDHRAYTSRPEFEAALDAALVDAKAELVCLAGFMRILTDWFVTRWHDRLINIHPSLLPAYKGLDTHARAIAAGEKQAGCTVHFVRAGVDDGPIIIQAPVPILPGDEPHTLAERVLVQEHRIYPEAVKLIAEGRVRVIDEKVLIDG